MHSNTSIPDKLGGVKQKATPFKEFYQKINGWTISLENVDYPWFDEDGLSMIYEDSYEALNN